MGRRTFKREPRRTIYKRVFDFRIFCSIFGFSDHSELSSLIFGRFFGRLGPILGTLRRHLESFVAIEPFRLYLLVTLGPLPLFFPF